MVGGQGWSFVMQNWSLHRKRVAHCMVGGQGWSFGSQE